VKNQPKQAPQVNGYELYWIRLDCGHRRQQIWGISYPFYEIDQKQLGLVIGGNFLWPYFLCIDDCCSSHCLWVTNVLYNFNSPLLFKLELMLMFVESVRIQWFRKW